MRETEGKYRIAELLINVYFNNINDIAKLNNRFSKTLSWELFWS